MNIQGAGCIASAAAVYNYSDSEICRAENVGVNTNDSAEIAAFNGEGDGGGMSIEDLQNQKDQAESERCDLEGQANDAQSRINARKGEITQEQADGEASGELQAEYQEAQAEFDEAGALKNEAQQNLNQISQESRVNEQCISSNAQQKQQVSSELTSAQSQLASLTPPAPPEGDDPEAQAAYQAELSAYEAQKNALESQINSLQAELQQLESEAQQLQAEKAQLAQAQQQAQAEIAQQDAAMQAAQAKMDAVQEKLTEDSPELQQALEEDEELQSLQEDYEQLQQQQAAKEAEISELDAQIAAAQSAEAEAADSEAVDDAEFGLGAEEIDDDVSAAGEAAEAAEAEESGAASPLPAEAYAEGQVTTVDDMKNRIIAEQAAKGVEISADDIEVISGTKSNDGIYITNGDDEGSITIEVNGKKTTYSAEEASRLIIDAGDGDDVVQVLDDISADLHIMGGKGDDRIYGGAGNDYIVDDYGHNTIRAGAGDDIIKMAGLGKRGFLEAADDILHGQWDITNTVYGGDGNDTIYAGKSRDTIFGEDGDDTIYAGAGDDEIQGGSGQNYINAGSGSDHVVSLAGEDGAQDKVIADGSDTCEKFTVSEDAKELRRALAQTEKIDENEFRLAFGTDGDDVINIRSGGSDGSLLVSVNGKEVRYTAAEARRLIIDGGSGNDKITVADDVVYQKTNSGYEYSLNIVGGDGDDEIKAGSGKDVIYDNYGSNVIDGGDGDNTMIAHGFDKDGVTVHKNTVKGGSGRDYIETGAGNDTIEAGEGGDVIYAGAGNDTVHGGGGDDFINAGGGNDEVWGEDGNDVLFGLSGNDKLYGGAGYDTLASGDGDDIVDGGAGADTVRYTNSGHGHDQVADDGSDDAKALDPIAVPGDHFVVGNQVYHTEKDADGNDIQVAEDMTDRQAQAFADFINDNLEAFAAIEPGQALLNGIADTQYKVTFGALNERNGFCSPDGGRGYANYIYEADANGVRSYDRAAGTDSIVKINPSFIDLGGGAAYSEQGPMIAMAHEMSHAYNNAKGNMDYAYYDNDTGELLPDLDPNAPKKEVDAARAIRGAELQAVGMYDDSTIAANPYGISENDYRQYFHMAPRTTYRPQNDDQYANSNHGNLDWEDTWH